VYHWYSVPLLHLFLPSSRWLREVEFQDNSSTKDGLSAQGFPVTTWPEYSESNTCPAPAVLYGQALPCLSIGVYVRLSLGKAPFWLRGLEIIAGIVSIIVSFYVVASPAVALLTIAIFFAVALFLLGIARVARGVGAKGMSSWSRAVSVIVGLLALALALATVVFPLLGDLTVAFLFAFGLLFTGIGSVAGGQALGKAIPSWLRYATIVIGVLGVIVACAILIFPLLGLATLVLLLGVNFFLFRLELVLLGAIGRTP